MKEDFKKIGLSENAIDVYLSLLKIGETPVGGIISDLKLHRQSVYNALEELEKRFMIERQVINKVNHYKISNPDILVEEVAKQALLVKRLAKDIKSEMKKSKHEHEINVYDGEEKIKRYLMNRYQSFPVGETVYIMNGYSGKFEKIMGEKFVKSEYSKLRKKREIHSMHLANDQFRNEFGEEANKQNLELRQTRFLPYNLTHLSTTVIWPDCVNIQTLVEHPFIIEIKNEKLRVSYLEQFKLLWKNAKK